MPTVIILSSSPPRVFARSTTPVQCSSPRQTSTPATTAETPSRNRFKTSGVSRDGFDGASSNARHVLADKNGGLNQTISPPPGRHKFKIAQSTESEEFWATDFGLFQESDPLAKQISSTCHPRPGSRGPLPNESEKNETASPLIVQRAISRRTDWTPPKPVSRGGARVVLPQSVPAFPSGLLDDFQYKTVEQSLKSCAAGTCGIKRQRLEQPSVEPSKSNVQTGKIAQAKMENITSTKRVKLPAKKALTITGLATSNFLGQDRQEASPLLEYLASTQIGTAGQTGSDAQLATKVGKTKAAVAKLRDSKKNRPKSLLVSPSSALKHLDEQEAVFGSASQLVREDHESVVGLNEPAVAQLYSDPTSSPPQSSARSAHLLASPRVGTSRFKQSRSLWDAAGRDEANALLHVDNIDLTDPPALRFAFTGRDVMMDQIMKTSKPSSTTSPTAHLMIQKKRPSVIDIDDVPTPVHEPPQHHAFHTKAQSPSPRKRASTTTTAEASALEVSKTKSDTTASRKTLPKKPNYAGLSDHDLKKQIAAYGFKAVRKREKMIELLEKCWAEKHGSENSKAEPAADRSGYGDILSHIHDVSTRPLPKVQKPPKPRKRKDETDKSASAKKPRQRKSQTIDDGSEVPKTTKKRKVKPVEISDRYVYDIDDLNDPIVRERRELGRFDDWARPPKTPKLDERATEVKEILTPSSSDHEIGLESDVDPMIIPDQGQTGVTEALPATKLRKQQLATPDDSQRSNICEQITKAINHESFTSNVQLTSPSRPSSSALHPQHRNHQTNPTWHEKILLYDPIILEDLAAWLNTKGLDAIGEDREVSALDVRTWCESRGICCLWKGGWRGQKGGD